jgi:hypothetical protein
MPAPTAGDVRMYLGSDAPPLDDVAAALAAERAAQSHACQVARAVAVLTVSGSATVTVDSAALVPGMFRATDVASQLVAAGVPAGVTVLSVAADGLSAVLSAAATATGAVTASVEWPPDLVEALCRRVAHNLAVRSNPSGVQVAESEFGVTSLRVGGLDPEVRRLESPHRSVGIA